MPHRTRSHQRRRRTARPVRLSLAQARQIFTDFVHSSVEEMLWPDRWASPRMPRRLTLVFIRTSDHFVSRIYCPCWPRCGKCYRHIGSNMQRHLRREHNIDLNRFTHHTSSKARIVYVPARYAATAI